MSESRYVLVPFFSDVDLKLNFRMGYNERLTSSIQIAKKERTFFLWDFLAKHNKVADWLYAMKKCIFVKNGSTRDYGTHECVEP